ncbi:MAG: hypothetical protein KA754_01090 [Corallincola sp.]|nr:hypothetical protein [Corallincola sp.]
MSFSQRQQLTQPFKIATMRQQGYLLELAPSFQSWFICFFDDRWRQSGLNQATIERNARDFDWSLDLLRRGHSPANQWAALGPFQGLRKLYHYYRGTSVGMQYIDDEQIYKHLAAALARGQMEVHKVYDPHEAYRAFAAAAASSGASSSAAGDESGSESKPETRRVGGELTQTQKNYIAATCTPFYGPCASPGGEEIMMKLAEGHTLTQGQLETIRGVAIVAGSVISGASLARSGVVAKGMIPSSQILTARQRQASLLKENVGFNVSPTAWDAYPTIGRNGTFISDKQGITDIIGDLPSQSPLTIDKAKAAQLENAFGLEHGALQEGFKIRQVDNIRERMTRSPLEGNQYFLGPGNHLPGGAPEMVIDSIPTVDSNGVTTLLEVIVK